MLQKIKEFSRLRGNDGSGPGSVTRRSIPCDVLDSRYWRTIISLLGVDSRFRGNDCILVVGASSPRQMAAYSRLHTL